MLIDSHAHLTYKGLDPIPLLKRAQEAGVTQIINICTTPEELTAGISLKKECPWIYNVAATTPHDVEKNGEGDFEVFASQTLQLVALGETGLDYHYQHSDRAIQQLFLKRYLKLAEKNNLPIVIHCREAFPDLFKILDAEFAGPVLIHCFTGNMEEALQVIERRWLISLSGIVTFKKSVELQEIAKIVPLEQLLIETDTPYLAPTPYRGKPNEPAYILETAKFLAELRGISFEELAYETSRNAALFFNL